MRRVVLVVCGLGWLLAFAAPARAGGGGEHCQPLAEPTTQLTVLVTDNCFMAKTSRVPAGSTVTWTLLSTYAPHTVSAEDGVFESGDLKGPFTVRFNAPGTYDYVCTYHGGSWGGMRGRVIVTGEPAGEGPDAVALLPETDIETAAERAAPPAPVVTVQVPPASVRATLSGPTMFALAVGPLAAALIAAFLLRRGRA